MNGTVLHEQTEASTMAYADTQVERHLQIVGAFNVSKSALVGSHSTLVECLVSRLSDVADNIAPETTEDIERARRTALGIASLTKQIVRIEGLVEVPTCYVATAARDAAYIDELLQFGPNPRKSKA